MTIDDDDGWRPGDIASGLIENIRGRSFFEVLKEPMSPSLRTLIDSYSHIPVSTWLIEPKNYTLRDKEIMKMVYPPERIDSGDKYSELNPITIRRVLSYWSKPGDYFLDPFYGWGTKMIMSIDMNRNYTGYDIQKRTIDRGHKLLETIPHSNLDINIHLSDGIDIIYTEPNSADIIFASPPYWKVETYGDELGQLGNTDYSTFLKRMKIGADNYYNALKSDKYCIMMVGDFRYSRRTELDGYRYRMFTSFHSDIAEIFKMAGFELHDIVIKIKSLPEPYIARSVTRTIRRDYTVKVHEYLMVFRKPLIPYKQFSVCDVVSDDDNYGPI